MFIFITQVIGSYILLKQLIIYTDASFKPKHLAENFQFDLENNTHVMKSATQKSK